MSSMEPDERTRRENAMWCRMDARDIAANTAKQLADLQHPVQAAVMARVANVLAEQYRDGVEWDAPIPAKAGPCSAADADMARWLLGKINEIERLVEKAGVTAWAGVEHGQDLASRGTTRSLAAIRAWAVDVETRATQANDTEGTTMEENKGAREQLDELRDAHNRALQAEERKVKVAYLGGEAQVDASEKHALEKALRAAQIEPVEELLKDAACTAGSMLEQTAENALWHIRETLLGEAAFATVIVGPEVPMPQTLPPWISPWEGDCARVIVDKVGKALELLSQYEWVKNHPAKPAKSLEVIHAWACKMFSKADHLEHNQRVDLERGRDALVEAQEYMREAVRMILRDNMTGEQALNYDRALRAVGNALVVVSDGVLRDKKPMECRPVEVVLTRRSAAMMAHRAISQWLYNTAEQPSRRYVRRARSSPFGDSEVRPHDIPPEAKAEMYRAAWAIGHCVMRDSQSLSEIAQGAARIVREHVAGWVRP